MENSDHNFVTHWARREFEERAKANDPACSARSIHEDVANRYADIVTQMKKRSFWLRYSADTPKAVAYVCTLGL